MRTRDEVAARLDEMWARKLAERKKEFLSRDYRNCVHNVRLRVRDHGKLGFCRNPRVVGSPGQPVVCDEEGTAGRCRYFECRNTEASVEADFEAILRSPARCGELYPKLAMLLWFLQDYKRGRRLARLVSSLSYLFRSLANILLARWW